MIRLSLTRFAEKAARLLIPNLQVELARLREERACARTGTLREREDEREIIGWT